MSSQSDLQPPFALAQIPDVKIRGLFAALAVTAVLFPLIRITSFGMPMPFQPTASFALGSLVYLLPLAFIGQLFAPAHPGSRPYVALIDLAAAAVAVLVVVALLVMAFGALREAFALQQAFGGRGGPSIFDAVGVMPDLGGVALLVLAVWSPLRTLRLRRAARPKVAD